MGTAQTRVAAGVLGALGLLLLTSCSSNDDQRGPSARPSPGAVTTVTLSKSTPLMVAGKDYKIESQVPTSVNGAPSVYLDRADRLQVMSVSATGSSERPNTGGDALAALEEGSKKPTILAEHGTPHAPRYIVDAVVAGRIIVWVETTQANMESMPWQIYTYDLDAGVEKHIASYKWFKIPNPPWPSDKALRPQVIGNWVYFVAVDHVDLAKRVRDRSIYRVPINGGRDPELVVPDAAQVYADGKKLQAEIQGELVGWDPSHGRNGRIAQTALPATCGSFANEGVRVTCAGKSKNLRVDSPLYGTYTIDVRGKDVGYLNATSRWVGFSTSAHAYVLDLKRGRLMRPKGAQSSSTAHLRGNELEYAKLNDGTRPPIPHISLLPR